MSKLKKILFAVLICAVLLSALCISFFRKSLRPTVVSMAENYATREATVRINECVAKTLAEDGDVYGSFVTFSTDKEGKVMALSTDSASTNVLKARISSVLANQLGQIKGEELYIPLGNVINVDLFAGKGPRIKVEIISVGALTTDFHSELESAGINQTLHRIMLDVTVNISLYVPFSVRDVTVKSSVCIAESVLVGEVPEAYTVVVENGDGLAGDINDYGAQNYMP